MVQLAEITWTDAKEFFSESDVVILPVGSTEQHGPHNPLGTDYLNAEAVSRVVGERTKTLVLPVIPVGVSEHHRQFPGTLWVPPQVFREYVEAVALSAASHGARKIVIVNGHGGNTASLLEVAGHLRRECGVFAVVVMAFPPGMMEIGGGHAGAGETSANLYWHPHLVKMERAPRTRQKERLGGLRMQGMGRVGPAQFPWDTIDLTETGLLGGAGQDLDASTASAEKIKPMMEKFLDNLCEFVEALKKEDVKSLLCKPHK
ncbi:creatininase family protein [Candidatus Bathyarchaeota archaeon]|nr:MAG: creatininase family protein [Candidatus Bathyarchaeota archaeon]